VVSEGNLSFASTIESRGIDLTLIEQPVPAADVRGLADVRHRVNIPIAADEAVFTPEDATRVVAESAADVLNVKLENQDSLPARTLSQLPRARIST